MLITVFGECGYKKEKRYMNKAALIIFVKNPQPGMVKTRLAATVGEKRALDIYLQLLDKTRKETENLAVDKYVFYSRFIDNHDIWDDLKYRKALQTDDDLGGKMSHAFDTLFAQGYRSVCIIGSDCYQISQAIIEEAFRILEQHDAVLGPSTDGGYYLLGMNQYYQDFFVQKAWSTDSVAAHTIADFKQLALSFQLLPVLTDIDEEKDLITIR